MKQIGFLLVIISVTLLNADCGRSIKFGQFGNDRSVAVAFLPNGDMVAGSDVYQGGKNRATVKVINAQTWGIKELGSFDIGTTDAIAVAPDGKNVVVGSNNAKLLRMWNLENNQMQTLAEDIHPRDLVFVANDSFVSAGYDALRLWSIGNKTPKIILKCSNVDRVAYSKSLNLLATSCDDSYQDSIGERILLIDFPTGQIKANQKLSEIKAQRLIFSPDGKKLAFIGTSSSRDAEKPSDLRSIRIYDFDLNEIKLIGECERGVDSIVFSPDGKQIASQCDADIVLWNLNNGERRSVGSCGGRDGAMSLAFSLDGLALAAACNYSGLAVLQTQ